MCLVNLAELYSESISNASSHNRQRNRMQLLLAGSSNDETSVHKPRQSRSRVTGKPPDGDVEVWAIYRTEICPVDTSTCSVLTVYRIADLEADLLPSKPTTENSAEIYQHVCNPVACCDGELIGYDWAG